MHFYNKWPVLKALQQESCIFFKYDWLYINPRTAGPLHPFKAQFQKIKDKIQKVHVYFALTPFEFGL